MERMNQHAQPRAVSSAAGWRTDRAVAMFSGQPRGAYPAAQWKGLSIDDTTSTFAPVFREALEARGMTLSALRQRLADRGNSISLASLSYWRSASRTPDPDVQRETIADVEELLGLAPGRLARLAARPPRITRPEDPGATKSHVGQEDFGPEIDEAARLLRVAEDDQVRVVSLQQVTDVGSEGFPMATTMQAVLQCVRGTIERVMYSVTSPDGYGEYLGIDVLEGGSDGGRFVTPRVSAVAVELDPPVEFGDTRLFTVRNIYPSGATSERQVGVGANQRTRKLVNWVRFHQDAIPDWLLETEAVEQGESRAYRRLDTPTTAHQVRWDFGPGNIQLDWGYGAPPELERA